MLKSIIGAVCACLVAVSFNVNAALVSVDWKTTGDNLITTDTVSGLDWLDLTETNDMSYNYVSGQLGSGGQFEGFRYATPAEVVDLWANWSIDLSTIQSPIVGADPAVITATSYLGNITCVTSCSPSTYGVLGMSEEPDWGDWFILLGAYHNNGTELTQTDYISTIDNVFPGLTWHHTDAGSYLVRASVVPIPSAVWLFGSGLIGLIGVARRKADA